MQSVAQIIDSIRDVTGAKYNSDIEELLNIKPGGLANLKKKDNRKGLFRYLSTFCTLRGYDAGWFMTGGEGQLIVESQTWFLEPLRGGRVQDRLMKLEMWEEDFDYLAANLDMEIEKGEEYLKISRSDLDSYSRKKGIRLDWLLTGEGEKNLKRKLKIEESLGRHLAKGSSPRWRTTSEEANRNRRILSEIKETYKGSDLEALAERGLLSLQVNKKPQWMNRLAEFMLEIGAEGDLLLIDAKALEGFFPKSFNSPATAIWQTSHDPDKPIQIKDTKTHNRDVSHMPDTVDEDSVKDELIASMKRELELLRKDNKRLESELEEFKEIGEKDL
jgi:hypothetical protein